MSGRKMAQFLHCGISTVKFPNKAAQVCISHLSAISGSCYLVMMWEAFIIGLFSGMITNLGLLVIERTTLDDPCGAFIAHGLNGIWGLLAVGIFGKTDHENMDIPGLLYGGIV